jgi:hypothetical protein
MRERKRRLQAGPISTGEILGAVRPRGPRAAATAPEEIKTQLEAVRGVMISASECDTWLTLREIAEMTRFGEASISAQLRHLRKPKFGSWRVEKRRRLGDSQIMVVNQKKMATRSSASRSFERSRSLAPGHWEDRIVRA